MTTAQLDHEIVLRIPREITSPETVAELTAAAMPHFEAASPLCVQARQIVVTDAADTAGMKAARDARLAIKAVRVNADKARVALKDESLRKGKAIDAVFNGLRDALADHEAYLQEQEEFAQRAESKRLSEIKVVRDQRLAAMGVDPAHYNTQAMTDEGFAAAVAGILAQQQAAKAAAEQAEADRLARIKADAEAREAQRAENERLKAEAVQREKETAIEREKQRILREAADAKAELERRAREKAEAELSERQAAEKKRKLAEAKAARKAANAPDREKLLAWASAIEDCPAAQPTGDEAREIVKTIAARIAVVIAELRRAAERI